VIERRLAAWMREKKLLLGFIAYCGFTGNIR